MNLLTDPLIPVVTDQGREYRSLPALLAGLGDDSVQRVDGLQRHQEDAFYVFLCYLAGAVLARVGDWNPVRGEDFWRERLRALAGKAGDDAWRLVVDDLSKPAFMQPPLPKADHGKLKLQAETPDALDLLPTAKNHDVKQARAARPESHEWLFALISLQTMDGYGGSKTYGISRMSSGASCRLVVETVRNFRLAPRWRDALQRLRLHRREVLNAGFGYRDDGLALVWLRPWDGKTSIRLSELDPFYIEICRRIRLQGSPERIAHASSISSDTNRIAAQNLNGVVGDAWLPIDLMDKKGAKALSLSETGWTVERMRRILFADGIKRTLLQHPCDDWKGPVWQVFSTLVRGRDGRPSNTDGFREARILIPENSKKRIFPIDSSQTPLARLSKEAVETASVMRNRVLKPAVFVLMEGAPEKIAFERDSATAWWERYADRFEQLWSDAYFPWLWSVPEPFDHSEQALGWIRRLQGFAEIVLRDAERALPQHTGRYWHARVAAERAFYGALYHNFPDLKEARHERTA